MSLSHEPKVGGTARCAVTARRAGGTFAVERPTSWGAPLDAALTAQRAVPTIEQVK